MLSGRSPDRPLPSDFHAHPWHHGGMSRLRLDEALVQRGLYATRSRARDAVIRGKVLVAGKAMARPGHTVGCDTPIEVDDEARAYVSRGALKLIYGLDHFGWSPEGCAALDSGVSTGRLPQ